MASNESVVDIYSYEVFGRWYEMVEDSAVRHRLIQKSVELLQKCGMFSIASVQELQVDPVVGEVFGACSKENGNLERWLIARYFRSNFERAMRELVDDGKSAQASGVRSHSAPIEASKPSSRPNRISLNDFLTSEHPVRPKSRSCRRARKSLSRIDLFSQPFVLRVLSFVESGMQPEQVQGVPDTWWINVADSAMELATTISRMTGEPLVCILNQQDLPDQVTSTFEPDDTGRIEFNPEDMCLSAILHIRSTGRRKFAP